MRNIVIVLLIFPFLSFAQIENSWMLNSEQSVIEYTAKHVLHQWKGINKNVKGIFIKEENSQIAVSANISDFDSGISNRDSNAIRVLNALNYPQVKFYSNNITIFSDKIKFEGELDFHGKKINKTIESNFTHDENSIKIDGKFSIVLTDFDIKLPSLMLVKMEDFADLNFKLIFEKSK